MHLVTGVSIFIESTSIPGTERGRHVDKVFSDKIIEKDPGNDKLSIVMKLMKTKSHLRKLEENTKIIIKPRKY